MNLVLRFVWETHVVLWQRCWRQKVECKRNEKTASHLLLSFFRPLLLSRQHSSPFPLRLPLGRNVDLSPRSLIVSSFDIACALRCTNARRRSSSGKISWCLASTTTRNIRLRATFDVSPTVPHDFISVVDLDGDAGGSPCL